MADGYFLLGPTSLDRLVASQLDLSPWVVADGVDFGEKGLVGAQFSESPLREGGMLMNELIGVRTIRIPLLLASTASYGILDGLAGLAARVRAKSGHGAHLEFLPEGASAAQRVRFDILSAGEMHAAVHISYQPRFFFMRGRL